MNILKHELLLVILVLLSTTITSAEDDGLLIPKASVSVINNLRSDLDLTIHCKSKNDDLGIHVLPYGTNFSFHFRPGFWGNTVFWCDMEWKYSTPKHFNIYCSPRDHDKCSCYQYHWSIKPDGPCMFNFKTNKYEFCYPWGQ